MNGTNGDRTVTRGRKGRMSVSCRKSMAAQSNFLVLLNGRDGMAHASPSLDPLALHVWIIVARSRRLSQRRDMSLINQNPDNATVS